MYSKVPSNNNEVKTGAHVMSAEQWMPHEMTGFLMQCVLVMLAGDACLQLQGLKHGKRGGLG